jgi:hypothetical protein
MGEAESPSGEVHGLSPSPVPPAPTDVYAAPRAVGVLGFLRRHPLVFLVLLSPGIPEYLSGSSAWSAIVLNPGLFLFQIAANLGLYGPGVILIREAKVRWHKGWATVLLLGAAYGILEEGDALSTLFDPQSNNAGALGTFGHWLGVSWVWASGVLLVHMVYSISIPILLVGLTLAETREKRLLGNRGIATAFAILGADVFVLAFFIARSTRFWMGLPVLVGSLVTISALIYLAYRAPAAWPTKRPETSRGLRFTILVGIVVYPVLVLIDALRARLESPVIILLLVVGWEYVSLRWAVRNLNFPGNERKLIAFVLGLLIPFFATGLVANFPVELVLVEDVALLLLFRYLFRLYPGRTVAVDPSGLPQRPPG